jgi:hypothetical protein
MADRFDVVAIRIEDKGPIVARMVLRSKPGTSVVVPTRRYGRLMEGIYCGAVIGSKRDMEGLTWLALADPEVRLAPPPEPRRRDAGFHDKLVAQRGEGFRVEALALLEIRDGNTYVIQHCSHLPRLQNRTAIRQAEYPRNTLLHNGELSRVRFTSKVVSCPETADHPDQTLDRSCKPLRQAQEADPYAAGHEANVAGHHTRATQLTESDSPAYVGDQ